MKRNIKNCKEYTKILNQLTWLKACSSSLNVATRISSVATLSTFISLPMSIPLGAVSLAGASVSGVATVLTKKHQKKFTKVTKLVDTVISALAVFETNISKALNNGKIDEQEFQVLQTLHLKIITKLSNVDHKMESETRTQLQKVCWKR